MSYDYNALVAQIASSRQHVTFLKDTAATKDNANNNVDNNNNTNNNESIVQYLQQSTETFATLSTNCPMTPLLWIQYASDTNELLKHCLQQHEHDDVPSLLQSYETQLQLLELGLEEFPGSAALHIQYIQLLFKILKLQREQQHNEENNDDENTSSATTLLVTEQKMNHAIDYAIECIGLGSHCNESELFIVTIYQLAIEYYLSKGNNEQFNKMKQLIQQRSSIPMGHGSNDGLITEIEQLILRSSSSESSSSCFSFSSNDWKQLEQNRRQVSKLYHSLLSYEEEIDMAMYTEGILPRHQIPKKVIQQSHPTTTTTNTNVIDWDQIIAGNDYKFWMGLGGKTTSDAFIKYALACARFRLPSTSTKDDDDGDGSGGNKDDNDMDHDDNEEEEEVVNEKEDIRQKEAKVQALALPIYERGIAECPTSESLWLSYIKHLIYLLQGEKGGEKKKEFPIRLKNVVSRAVRNCPYSLVLYQQKIQSILLLSELGHTIFDPDELMTIVQDGITMKFITTPSSCLDLYLSAIKAMKRRILSLLSTFAGIMTTPTTLPDKKNKKNKKQKSIELPPVLLKYDDAEPFLLVGSTTTTNNNNNNSKASSSKHQHQPIHQVMDDSLQQEIQDLCEDIREMYDAADVYLRKNQESWSEGRVQLWAERGETERQLISLLMEHFNGGENDDDDEDDGENVGNGNEKHNGSKSSTLSKKSFNEILRCFEKVTKVHQPAHPDSYIKFLQTFQGCVMSTAPSAVISRLRQVRGLFQKALHSVGRTKKQQLVVQQQQEYAQQAPIPRDFDTAFRCLCHDYLVFETTFGSEKSLALATKAIEKKTAKMCPTPPVTTIVEGSTSMTQSATATTQTSVVKAEDKKLSKQSSGPSGSTVGEVGKNGAGMKRKLDQEGGESPSVATKKIRTSQAEDSINGMSVSSPPPHKAIMDVGNNNNDDDPAAVVVDTAKSTTAEPKSPEPEASHKIKIGKLHFPAHPFTVRVSNLAKETEDMDLVDCFRPRCGKIVHAKVVREKIHGHFGGGGSGKGASKGWGLVQFEERSSVEKALELTELIGIHEKLVKVDRSHVPAAGLVPPGMHRVNPRGEGKSSKRNQKRREQQGVVEGTTTTANKAPLPAADKSQMNQQTKVAELEETSAAEATKKPSNAGILAFRPRGVGQGRGRRKVKLELSASKEDSIKK